MLSQISSQRVRRGLAVVASLLFLLLAAGALRQQAAGAALAASTPRESAAPVRSRPGGALVFTDSRHDTSAPLRSMPFVAPQPRPNHRDHNEQAINERVPAGVGKDPVSQNFFGFRGLGLPVIPPTIANFDGMYNLWGPIPPDTNGDVGPHHYYQIVNNGIQIFSKTGTSLYGPADTSALWHGFGGPCESRDDGDPIALYDPITDRWFASQFTTAPPYGECIAISVGGDPLGAYHRYFFNLSDTSLFDYPHCGVWPDAYYCGFNVFDENENFVGAAAIAFERAAMLAGQTARAQAFVDPDSFSFMPADIDGHTMPPVGEPNVFSRISPTFQALLFFDFHVDWTTPANTTFGQSAEIPVAAFDNPLSIPQPGTTIELSTLAGRLMFRGAYRNMGTHQALVLSHSIVGANGSAAPRWYEVRSSSSSPFAPTLYQQGTYNPDTIDRWMPSAAMDHQGNIAVGYSASSTTVYPSIRYTGRLATDPLGTTPQGEGTIIAGAGSQTNGFGRWGDYSDMTVDPVDDCTFWYTTEYLSVTGDRNWRTRIGSFKFPQCIPAVVVPTSTPTGATATRTSTPPATATACPGALSITGAITNTDPTMAGRLAVDGIIPSCAAPKNVPPQSDSVPRHYKVYTYTNSTAAAQCVTVRLTNNCGNNALLSTAYLDTFDPQVLTGTNYLADTGHGDIVETYSFDLPAGHRALVVVEERSANVGCANFSLTINPCAALPTHTGTVTPTPTITGTPTQTATFTRVPCSTAQPVNETFESGLGNFTAEQTPADAPGWGIVATPVHSGAGAVFGSDNPYDSEQTLTYNTGIAIPAGATQANLTFWHRFDTEETWDGGQLEISTDNGATWADIGAEYFVTGGYNVLMSSDSPFGKTPAWSGNSGSSYSYVNATLVQYAGQTIRFRFREASDSSVAFTGWWVDDVQVITGGPACTPTATGTPTATSTRTATNTRIATATSTRTLIPVNFIDVHRGDFFYDAVQYLAGRGVISGYGDNTFRPYNPATRAQMVKIVTLAFNIPAPTMTPGSRTFQDVDTSHPFYVYIETAAHAEIVSGYACGGLGEPCVAPLNRPYFRPSNNVTRGQLSKIVAIAAHWALIDPAVRTFADVFPNTAFYTYVETAACHAIISGYTCGGPGETCDDRSRPYFRQNNNATRGQIAKIVYNAVAHDQACTPPTPSPTATGTAQKIR